MKKALQTTIASAVLAGSLGATTAVAEGANGLSISGNAGIMSDYIFRGIFQDTGVGNGGLDIEFSGLYLGTWVADVDEGIEYDIYGGYIYEFDNFYAGLGYTAYRYTDEFDDDYDEVNFYFGGSFSDVGIDLEYTDGEYDGDFSDGDEYTFFAATVSYGPVSLTYGDFGDDADDDLGNYWELAYSMELAGFDLTAGLVNTDIDDSGPDGDDDETQAFVSIGWGWDVL